MALLLLTFNSIWCESCTRVGVIYIHVEFARKINETCRWNKARRMLIINTFALNTLSRREKWKIDCVGGENWTISGGENSGHRRNMEEPFNNSICKQKLFVMLPSKEGMWGKERSCDINKSFAITAEAGSLLGNFPFCLSPIHLVLIQLARLTLSCGHRGGGENYRTEIAFPFLSNWNQT